MDRQRRAGFVMTVRLGGGNRGHRLRQEPAGGAVVVVMVRRRSGHVGRCMLAVAGMMMPAVCNVVGRCFVLMAVQ